MTRNDVTSSFVQIIDVDPSQARGVLSQINPMRSLADRLAVHTDGAGRTVLSLRLEGRGSDMNARSRMLSSWTFLEELAESHTRRLARTVDDFVNAAEYDRNEELPAARPRLLAAV